MELIYFATSNKFPGLVKIGRTDRSLHERMSELSHENYGPSNFFGDSEWEAVEVLRVKNNEEGEALLHDHFQSIRLENNRELFLSEDPSKLAQESAELLNTDLLDITSTVDFLDGVLPILSAVVGVSVLLSVAAPNSVIAKKTKHKTEQYFTKLENEISTATNQKMSSEKRLKSGAKAAVKTSAVGAAAFTIIPPLGAAAMIGYMGFGLAKESSNLVKKFFDLKKWNVRGSFYNYKEQLNKLPYRLHNAPTNKIDYIFNAYHHLADEGNVLAHLSLGTAYLNAYEFRPDIKDKIDSDHLIRFFDESKGHHYLWNAIMNGSAVAIITEANIAYKSEAYDTALAFVMVAEQGSRNSGWSSNVKGCSLAYHQLNKLKSSLNKLTNDKEKKSSKAFARHIINAMSEQRNIQVISKLNEIFES